MITQWQSGETIVGRLRIEGARVDPAIAQLRLSTLLNNAVSHPAALPPSAIVFIRKLSDPLPRSIRLLQGDIRPSQAWQRALNAKLESLVTNAARPALGAVPVNTEAVVFLDRSELLTSLASDWCDGQLATRWWWQNLLRKASASQIVNEFWRSAPEYVPAALDKLARAEKVVRFVATFSDLEARTLLIAVARTFSLDDLARVVDQVPAQRLSELRNEKASLASPRFSIESGSDIRTTVKVTRIAPWSHSVRESETTGLGPEQQRFLGVALMLQRAPVKVRMRSFAREVEAWSNEPIVAHAIPFDSFKGDRRKVTSDRQTPSLRQERVAHAEDPLVSEAPSPKEFSVDSVSIFPKGDSSIPSETTSAVSLSHHPIVSPLNEEVQISEQPATSSQRQPSSPVLAQNLTTLPVERESFHSESSVITTEPPTVTPDEFPLIELQTSTEFGGLFYLINLGIYLGLYGDFTTPQEPGIELNVWDFVALLGVELVGEPIKEDPLWTLLERLSGRTEGEEPGSTFEAIDEWRMPPEWLKPFAGDSLRASWTTRGRLHLFHSIGFLVLDVPLASGDPSAQFEQELKLYEHLKLRVSSLELDHDLEPRASEPRPAVRAWLDRLMPYVRARLQKALGLRETEDPARLLCKQHAQISVTPTHVDVFMSLSNLPIEIRFAGLDRDCGWLPAAGRFINFHFE